MSHNPSSHLGIEQATMELSRNMTRHNLDDKIKEDITQLRENVEFIKTLFDRVLGSLEDFDSTYFDKPSDAGSLLAPDWQRYRERFHKYVDRSRESATAAHAVMEAYTHAVLRKVGKEGCDVQALKKEINNIDQKVKDHTCGVTDVHDDFRTLARDVKDFERKVGRAVKKVTKQPFPGDITKLCNDIEDLKEKIATISAEVTVKESDFLELAATLSPRIAKILFKLSPKTAEQASRYVTPVVDSEVSYKQEAQAELKKYAEQMPALLARGDIPPEILPFYQNWWTNTQHDILDVAVRIDTITDIWDAVRLDMVSLQTFLDLSAGAVLDSGNAFIQSKIEISREVCELLAECLKLYVQKVPAKNV